MTPRTYRQAMKCEDAQSWEQSFLDEIASLETFGKMEIVPRPSTHQVIPTTTVFKIATDPITGKMKYKTRICARGDLELDKPDNVYAPVAGQNTIKTMLALAVQNKMIIRQADVKCAYLHGKMDQPVYLELPQGHSSHNDKNTTVWKTNRSIYGLSVAGKTWYEELSRTLKQMKYEATPTDNCVFTNCNASSNPSIILVYVDDILYMSRNPKTLKEIEISLAAKYPTKTTPDPKSYVSINMDVKSNKIVINQHDYAKSIAERFEMDKSKYAQTPMETGLTLTKAETPMRDITLYQEIVGSLLYLQNTRPDISYAVNQLTRMMSSPSKEHLKYAKRVLSYTYHNNWSITYRRYKQLTLTGYVDASFANASDRKSTTGYVICLNDSPIIWKTQSQRIVALSTAESEYIGLTSIVQEISWLVHLLKSCGIEPPLPIHVYNDNQAAIRLAHHPTNHGRTKHIDVRYHYIREQIKSGLITISYQSSKELTADLLTKALPAVQFSKLRARLFGNLGAAGLYSRGKFL